MPKFIMLVGVPGSGKSTWIRSQKITNDAIILSTDNYIEEKALREDETYTEAFPKYIEEATAQMYEDLEYALQNGKDIIWDQTNTTLRGRRNKIQKIPGSYDKIAVVFNVPDDLTNRLKIRDIEEGKHIPQEVIDNMIKYFEPPTRFEGFSKIIHVN